MHPNAVKARRTRARRAARGGGLLNITPTERFLSKVQKTDGCWFWTAATNGKPGYGVFAFNRRQQLAHRVAYELFVGPVPDGLTLDHLCRVRNCVNPEHLEPVTLAENIDRGKAYRLRGADSIQGSKTHCPKGHPYDEANTRIRRGKKGGPERVCRTCEHRQRVLRRLAS